jgi:hypothetical protein
VCYRVFAAQRRSTPIFVVQPFIDGDRDVNRDVESIAASDPTIRTAKGTAAC